MTSLYSDLRYAARQLLKSPVFTLVTVLSLGLGIGVNTTIFSVVSNLLLRPLPLEEPARVVGVYTSDFSGPLYGASAYPDYVDMRDRSRSFDALASSAMMQVSIRGAGQADVTLAQAVTGNYFRVVGAEPTLGRYFAPDEDRAGGRTAVAVLSEGSWKRRFGGDPAIVGKSITVGGQPFTVVGIGPEGFSGAQRGIAVELWVPMHAYPLITPERDMLVSRGSRGMSILGRLRSGATAEQAQAELSTIAAQLHAAFPQEWTDVREQPRRITVVPESHLRIPPVARKAAIGGASLIMGLAGLVLLIACANIGNMLLARASARRREIAIRLSLGAGRGRLVRQLLTESVVLALLGGLAGVLAALWSTDLLSTFRPPTGVPILLDFSLDYRALVFALLLSMATGIFLGLAPALQATRPALVASLREDTPVPRRSRVRNLFVVVQVSLSLVLLVAAGLFLRSLRNASVIDPGFRTRTALLVPVDLTLNGYSEERGRQFFEELTERLRGLPGVEAVATATNVPLAGGGGRRSLAVVGHTRAPGEDMEFRVSTVSAGYFAAMGIELAQGREFTAEDRPGAPGAIIVNEAFAQRFWPGQAALGKPVQLEGDEGPVSTVVGVARNGKYSSLGEEPVPFYYMAAAQHFPLSARVIVRTSSDPAGLVGPVRGVVQSIDRNLPLTGITTLAERLDDSLLPARVAGIMLGAFGLLGLTLAALGLYGVMAYSVAQRTHEIGIRMALGARAADVLQLVVRQGAALAGLGVGIGLLLALVLSRLVRGFLYGLAPTDPVTFGGVVLVLAAVALLASYIPARRAATIEPMRALRNE